MLIGIMHHAEGPRGGFSPFEYHSRILQSGDLLRNSDMVLTLEDVLDILLAFRQECPCHSFFFDNVAVTAKRHIVVLSGGIAALIIAVYLNDFIVEIASEKRRYEREVLHQNRTVLRDREVC